MPKPFPFGPPDDEGHPTFVDFYPPTEAAPLLHVSRARFRELCASGEWPCLRWYGRYYVNAEQMRRIVELRLHDVDQIPQWEPDGKIGEIREPWDESEPVS